MKTNSIHIALLLFTAVFFSCKSSFTTVTDVKKALVMPGVPQGQIYINYTATIELTAPAVLQEAFLKQGDKSIPLTDYSLIDLATGSIMKNDAVLPVGKYFFSARLIKQENTDKKEDVLNLRFKNERLETVAKKVDVAPTQFRK